MNKKVKYYCIEMENDKLDNLLLVNLAKLPSSACCISYIIIFNVRRVNILEKQS